MKTRFNLTNMKSRYFMLVVCLTLILGTTACSNEEFGTDLPEQEKTYTRQELIEQALSRMPQTKANNGRRFVMVALSKTINIQCYVNEDVVIITEESRDTIHPNSPNFSYTFTDNYPSHSISITGSEQAITQLNISENELILLDIFPNTKLTYLLAFINHLDAIDLSGCPNLEELYIADNDLISLDLTYSPKLAILDAIENQLKDLNLSGNPRILSLWLNDNQLQSLDISIASELYSLDLNSNPLQELKLPKVIPDFSWFDASFTQLTELDLSGATNSLQTLLLKNVPLRTLNNKPLDSLSFSNFTALNALHAPYTSLALDLSKNFSLSDLNISNSNVAQLNVSNTKLRWFDASYSQLTDIIYNDLSNLYMVRIERTPFEKRVWDDIKDFFYSFSDRTNEIPGHLYTYSLDINKMYDILRNFNWLINQ